MHIFIKNLLNGQSVEWKTLGEVAELRRGRVMSKEYLADNKGDYPVYSSQTANNGEIGKINTFDFEGEFVTWTTDGANAGTAFYRNGKFSITNVCGLVILNDLNQLNYKFIYYWLCIEAKKYVYSGMGNPKLMSNQMEKVKIPIPPLTVQQKIAQILDAFTAITAELTAEYTLRIKQYQYYRDKLLSENELGKVGFEWKTLNETCLKTQNIKWKNDLNSYQYIDLTSVDKENNHIIETLTINAETAPSRAQKIVKTNDVIFATTRPTQMRLAIIPKEFDNQIASTGYCVLRVNRNETLPKWIYFNLTTLRFKEYLDNNQSGSAYPAISDGLLKEFQIPIPSLETQIQIVAILDKFDTLINSISEGLPKEISLRQKQYEYYRQVLLGFESI